MDRIRVESTRDGFRGRRAGRHFDVTPAEYALYGPNGEGDDAGLLKMVDGPANYATEAAVRAAAELGVNLADVHAAHATAPRVTAAHVRAYAKRTADGDGAADA